MKTSNIIFLSTISLFLSCGNDDKEPAGDKPVETTIEIPLTTISIDPARQQQMDGVGANCWTFVANNEVGWNWEKTKFIFDELDIHYIRMAGWYVFWEESNDNNDPYSIDMDEFDQSHTIERQDLALAKYAASKGIEIDLGIWSVPDWMLKSLDPHIVDPAKYDELGESIAAYILFMKENGIDIRVTDIQNEPNIEAGNQYESPENFRDATLQVVQQLDTNGISGVKINAPNLATPEDIRLWGEYLIDNPELKNRLAAITYHTWWVDDFNAFNDIREFAEENKMQVWATEMGYCALVDGCFGGTHFLKPETWGTAWDFALSYYRAIAWSRASRLYHWSLLGHDAVISNNGQKFVSFYVLKHFTQFIKPGSFYHESSSDEDTLLPMVFELPEGGYSIIVINESTKDKFTDFALQDKLTVSEAIQTTKLGYYKDIDEQENNSGDNGYLLPGESLTSFILIKE